ncbi:MAG: hypothetical protein QW330_02655, partial [Nitrososphaerota archaeon]
MAEYVRWALRRYAYSTVQADVQKLKRCIRRYGRLEDLAYVAERVAEETDISLGRKSSILNTLLRLAKFRGDQSPV